METADTAVDGRMLHYAQFYGLEPVPDDGPVLMVHGNCQAEALRVLLDDDQVTAVRIPPVFEMTSTDLPHLQRLLPRVHHLVVQPIVPDYRDMPLGTDQVASLLPPGARVVRVPSLYYGGLCPAQAIVRVAGEPDPPAVPYYDLRTVLDVSERRVRPRPFSPEGVRAHAAASLDELRRREALHGTVPAADLFLSAGADAALTVNHPGNGVLVPLARRVQEALGLQQTAVDPGRVLLREILSPVEAQVLAALGLPGEARGHWVIRGEGVTPEEVAHTQREWLEARPHAVEAALTRHAATIEVLWPDA